MKTKINSREFANVVKNATKEINGTFKSPFVIVNLLNKATKGDFRKIENCAELSKDNIAKVANIVKTLHNGRYAFDLSVFNKDHKGRFCTIAPYKGEIGELVCDYYDIMGVSALIRTDNKGREIVENAKGELCLYMPIALTETAFFRAFAKVAKVDLVATEKAQKATEKARKQAEKTYKAHTKGVMSDYNGGKITEHELAEKLSAIKANYNTALNALNVA